MIDLSISGFGIESNGGQKSTATNPPVAPQQTSRDEKQTHNKIYTMIYDFVLVLDSCSGETAGITLTGGA